ncbi:MAG: sigma-70 family RNA polymerase sigma factor, partial [Clostridia bacterium]|nr:sigma-70 family RNA polymerase sigma factor [Clostridia bacterium]
GADDLISIGVIGLIKAVNSFRPESGAALGTYAAKCIENEILMTLRASRKRMGDVSLSEPIGTDGEGNEVTFMDVLGTDHDALEEEVIRRVTLERVRQVLYRLPTRERLVLELRYGLADGVQHPQHEIAEKLGISRSYV